MKIVPLGKTGLSVSQLGYGLSELGSGVPEEEDNAAEAGRTLNLALDSGINFLDTSACYENSEETIGRFISHRRGTSWRRSAGMRRADTRANRGRPGPF